MGMVIFHLSIPVLYRWNDPVEGEKYRPIEIIPEANNKSSG